jgi:hypothetical protein
MKSNVTLASFAFGKMVDEIIDDYQQPLPLPVDIWRITSKPNKRAEDECRGD